MEKGKAVPTGCYKCGRPGHWSRDCPDSNPNPNLTTNNFANSNSSNSKSSGFQPRNIKAAEEKPKKVARTRPKLTPDLLLSDNDGLGYILRYFPRNFRCRGRGHEVGDLGHLIGMYSQWHSHLLSYYSFEQFIHKVEQVAATKRIKTCIRDLRERVARGGDPSKLQDSPVEHLVPNGEQVVEVGISEGLQHENDPSSSNHNADAILEDTLQKIDGRAIEVPSEMLHSHSESQKQNIRPSCPPEVLMTEEQRARMEANRLKALERAAARACSLRSN